MKSPLKISLKTEIIPLLLIIGAIVISFVSYPYLPNLVVSHWNFQGTADGYSSKMFHAIFFPALLIIMYALFLFLPAIDPKKENYTKFAPIYSFVKNLIIGVFFIIFVVATLFNLGYEINIGRVISAVIGLMLIAIGLAMRKLKDNWFIGVRTPWTMSSQAVWEKTHKISVYSFSLFGIIIIAAPYLPMILAGWLFFAGVLITILLPVVYSYIIFQKEKKHK